MTVTRHEHNHEYDHININTIDPTKTLTLRDRFSRDMNKRFRVLKGVINKSIIDNDVFGLIERPTIFQGENLSPLSPRLFEFKTISGKVDGFMEWLRVQQERGVLEIVPAPLGAISPAPNVPWTNTYIQHSYQKGIARGRTELIKAGADVDPFGGEGLFTPSQSITQAFNQPFHATRAAALYTRTFSELRGITEAMDQQISRVLTDGLLAGLNPRVIARNINNRVDKIGAHRGRLLARTEIIRAHHVANIQEYRAAEIERVIVRAEWLTAGDKRVCPRCAGFEGRVFSLKQIEPLIPLHPACRCVAIPIVPRDRRFGPAARRRQITPGQIRRGRAGELPSIRIPRKDIRVPTSRQRNLVPAADDLATCLISDNIGTYIFTTLVRPEACKDIYKEGTKYFQQGQEITDKKILKRIDKLAIPPAWTDVVIATDPKAKMQAIGLDAAKRWQSRYSAKSIQKAAQKKFNRIKSFNRDVPTILRKMDADVNLNNPRAMLLKLESKTAIRAGSTTDFKARKKAYGLTTLQNEHVTIIGDRIKLNFVAKEGIPVKYELTDRTLAKWLLERKSATKSGEMLFPDVSASQLNTYIKKLANGKKYTIKDFRTYHGTRIAKDELEPFINRRLNIKERKDVVKKVTETVSSFLKNTPIMAKNSYIDPMVWQAIGGLP